MGLLSRSIAVELTLARNYCDSVSIGIQTRLFRGTMPTVTPEHLKELQAQLKHYVDPENRDGFFRVFVIWVVKTWQSAKFYDTEIVDQGFDCSIYPVKTDQPLSEHAIYYRDFINAKTGETVATFVSGSGIVCECMRERFEKVYAETCYQKITAYIEQHGLTVPEDAQEFADTVAEAIFAEAFETPELQDEATEIIMAYGELGSEQEPYTCDAYDFEKYRDNFFGTWTLTDFQNAMTVKTKS